MTYPQAVQEKKTKTHTHSGWLSLALLSFWNPLELWNYLELKSYSNIKFFLKV